MACDNGVSIPQSVAAIRHLASYAGYPSASVALQQLRQSDRSEEPQLQPVDGWDLTAETVDALPELDEEFAGFVANQYNQ